MNRDSTAAPLDRDHEDEIEVKAVNFDEYEPVETKSGDQPPAEAADPSVKIILAALDRTNELKDELKSARDELAELKSSAAPATAIEELKTDWEKRLEAFDERMAAAESRAPDVETKARGDWADELFDERGEELKALHEGKLQKLRVELKTLDIMGSSELGDSSVPTYRPGLIAQPHEAVGLGSEIRTVPSGEVYYFTRQTEATRYGGPRTTAVLAGDSVATNQCEFAAAAAGLGFMVGQYVNVYASSGGALLFRDRISAISGTTVTFATSGIIDEDDAAAVVRAETGFGLTAEEGSKPQQYLGLSRQSVTLKALASVLPTTRNRLQFAAGLRSFIESQMRARWARNLSLHLLYGDATTGLHGLANDSDVQTWTWSTSGTAGTHTTRFDALMQARSDYLKESAPGVFAVMNQSTLTKFMLSKNSEGDWLAGGPFNGLRMSEVGGNWYIGDLKIVLDGQVYDDQCFIIDPSAIERPVNGSLMLEAGYVDDDFLKNQITLRIEGWTEQAILQPRQYCHVILDAAPSA